MQGNQFTRSRMDCKRIGEKKESGRSDAAKIVSGVKITPTEAKLFRTDTQRQSSIFESN